MIVAAVVSAAKPWTGSSLTTFWPIVLMIRQPPAAVPSEIAVAASEDHPERDRRARRRTPAGDEGEGDDAHRLLGVVRAVAERHERGGDDLEPPEPIVDPARVGALEDVQEHDHQREADDDAEDRRRRRAGRAPCRRCPSTVERRRRPSDAITAPMQAADQRVARRARDPEPPGDQVPGDRADERRGDDDLAVVAGRASSRCPDAIVLATAVPVSAPTKFAVADMRIACSGAAPGSRPTSRSRWRCRGSR